MIYTTTSIEETIGRVIRNTRVQDSSYITDMWEWIPEAMAKMQTRQAKRNYWKDVEIHFYKGRLPCGLDSIKAVEYNGCRLRYSNSARTADAALHCPPNSSEVASTTGFISVPTVWTTPSDTQIYQSALAPLPLCTQDLQSCLGLPLCDLTYFTELDYIGLDRLSEACIRVHYLSIPLDENGLPLIPDNENYKTAIYYYCRGMMIGAGYEDKVFTYDKLMAPVVGLFEVHAARAIAQIRYPSPDQMESRINTGTRFVPPADYFSRFFSTTPEQPIIRLA